MMTYTAFQEDRKISHGSLHDVAAEVKRSFKHQANAFPLIFSDTTGKQIDLDFSGSDKDVQERLKMYLPSPPSENSGAGRPKLGVIAREISLQPKHWEWLLNQESSPSGAIRKLIDDKMAAQNKDDVKFAQERTYKVLTALAGNLPNFEEVIRFLYRKDKKKFLELTKDWPKDIVKYATQLSKSVFD